MSDFVSSSSTIIESLTAEQGQAALPELIALLQDVVDSGASVGFLPPLSENESQTYWQAILNDITNQSRILLVAKDAGQIVGSVQLELAGKANAQHRAEVQKLFVLQNQRQKGTGRRLMAAIEQQALTLGRTLLVLDTRQGDVAEQLYRKLGYVEAGVIPGYARNAEGSLDGTVIFYKQLKK